MKETLSRWKQEARLVSPLARRISEYERLAENEQSNTYVLEKALVVIKGLLDRISDSENKQHVQAWYAKQAERVRQLKDEFRFRFGTELKSALEGLGMTLAGQFPILTCGFYALKIDFENGQAALFWGPEIERIRSKIKLSAPEIAGSIAAFDKRLKGSEFKPDEFLHRLSQAYEGQLETRKLVPGTRILLIDLLPALTFAGQTRKFAQNPTRENFREYSRIQFGFDLFRIRQSGRLELDGQRLQLSVATFDATIDRAKSLWVPDNDRGAGTYYSHVAFVENRGE